MKIALVASLYESALPKYYGGTERGINIAPGRFRLEKQMLPNAIEKVEISDLRVATIVVDRTLVCHAKDGSLSGKVEVAVIH